MNRFLIALILLIFNSTAWAQNYEPIITKKKLEVDTFYNQYIVKDEYRWLEDIHTNDTEAWLKRQNKQAKKYLYKCSNKTNSFIAIDRYAYSEYDLLSKRGNYYFRYAYYNNVGVPALFYKSSLKSRMRLLIDPNYISSKDKITLKYYSVSKDSKYLAYQFSRNGSDWVEIKVVSLKGGRHHKDHLKGIKFSNIAWSGDGFFYSTINQSGQFGKSSGGKVFYHKLGTTQEEDTPVFARKNNSSLELSYRTTSNERFFILEEYNEESGKTNIFYIDSHSEQKKLRALLAKIDGAISIFDSHDGKLIARTNYDTKGDEKIVEIDPENPKKWREIVPEYSDAILLHSFCFSDRIVVLYQVNNHQQMLIGFDYSGTGLFRLELEIATSISGFSASNLEEELFFYSTSYVQPPVVYKLNTKTFKLELTERTTVSFEHENIEHKAIEYQSKDGVPISMILIYEKGMKLDGTNPTLLKTYGGFGVISTPSFDPGIVHLIKKGGIFAYAYIRGGGEKGGKWGWAGSGKRKQNSFDDIISAAEFLIDENYTSKEKLAITGGSNGGLVVAVAGIQRPDLFKVIVPVVAPLDMLRFEKFTIGHWHTDEYGTVNDSLSFKRLYQYSPYHNIKEDVNYPTMLVITSDNDDRVPPFHSYKFVARLQNRSVQKNPILLKVEKKAGHHGASTLVSRIREKADLYGFILNELTRE